MISLITGASSGLGRDMARKLSNMGYDLILVARSKDKLEILKKEFKTNITIIESDLSVVKNIYNLYDMLKEKNIDILINNAGFGLFGKFADTDLDNEINMIDLNVKAYHILTKLFLKDMVKRNSGRILNVASSAAFEPGPLMSTYYATKSYVYNLTTAIYEELRKDNSNVKISILCPGPVNTNFNNRANVVFNLKSLPSEYVANYAITKMLQNKLIIIPGISIKLGVFGTRFIPRKLLLKIMYNVQRSKGKKGNK